MEVTVAHSTYAIIIQKVPVDEPEDGGIVSLPIGELGIPYTKKLVITFTAIPGVTTIEVSELFVKTCQIPG